MLIVVDEASILSGPDLADLIAYAQACGAKVILVGDVSQPLDAWTQPRRTRAPVPRPPPQHMMFIDCVPT
jgi:hypothetical protein